MIILFKPFHMSKHSWAHVAASGIRSPSLSASRFPERRLSTTIRPPDTTNLHEIEGSEHSHPTKSASADDTMVHRGRKQKNPLIVSLRLNQTVTDKLTTIRRENFPSYNNNLDAHLTILHALPAEARTEMQSYLQSLTQGRKSYNLAFGHVQAKPRIVLLPVRSKALNDAVYSIQERFWDLLSDQDRKPFHQGHITLCNKRPEEEVAERGSKIQSQLEGCEAWRSVAEGFDLWVYQGNEPWKHISYHPFEHSVQEMH